MLDLLIKGGTVVDGSGARRFAADVGIAGGRIASIGRIGEPARRVIDAGGLIVAPGFIDGHTHMDAQVMWDAPGTCSCYHGVTSVVMSNGGFTLAPCRPADREWYASCLSYVEDIPAAAMAAGIDWTWETFPEHMAAVERRPKGLNYAMYVGHSALRMYIMGRRALTDPASDDEIRAMTRLVQEALRAGAVGVSTSLTHTHLTPEGTPVASRQADWKEMFGQGTTRSINAIFSLKSYFPFDVLPEWHAVRSRPLEEQMELLRDPARRRALVAAEQRMKPRDNVLQGGGAATTDPRKPDYGNLFVLRGVDWDDPSVEALSRARGTHPVETIIDLSLENPDQVYVWPVVNERPEDVLGMLTHDFTLATFSDSGAHSAQEMGSSLQTHFLHYWVNRRGVFTLEQAVRKMTHDNAQAFELAGRGLVQEGYHADLVLFEADRVRPQVPRIESDLPGGARRLVQKADGIQATIVNGTVTLENGEPTGHFAGQVLKGALAGGR